MEHLYEWLIGFGILGSQHYISRRKGVYWGAIPPISYIIFLIVLYATSWHGGIVSLILPAVGGEVLLCGIWIDARESLKKKRQKELEKIQVQDL